MSSLRQVFGSVFVVCVLLWATMNALSWFAWSGTFMGLFIQNPKPSVGIGFPLLVWTSEATADSFLPNVTALLGNLTIGLTVSAGLAAMVTWIAARGAIPLRPPAAETASPPSVKPPQYSLRSLLLAMTITSILLAIIKYETNPLRGALVLICLAGPGMTALAGHLTRRFGDKFSGRVTLGLALVLMIAAAVLGESLRELHDFTRALMAIFVCWTPQFVLIVLGLQIAQFIWRREIKA